MSDHDELLRLAHEAIELGGLGMFQVDRLAEGVLALSKRVEECEAEHPPEPEYLRWQETEPALRAEIKDLQEKIAEDNEVCLCGCPPEKHEHLGEDGECCEDQDHACLRTAPAIEHLASALRAEVAQLQKERDEAQAESTRLFGLNVELTRDINAAQVRTYKLTEDLRAAEAERDALAAELARVTKAWEEHDEHQMRQCCDWLDGKLADTPDSRANHRACIVEIVAGLRAHAAKLTERLAKP